MDMRNIVIDAAKTVGRKLVLTDIKPAYAYDNGQRTDRIEGYRYEIAMPEHGYDKLSVRIDGDQQVVMPDDDYPMVTFSGLVLTPYWTSNGYAIRATADHISIAGDNGKHKA